MKHIPNLVSLHAAGSGALHAAQTAAALAVALLITTLGQEAQAQPQDTAATLSEVTVSASGLQLGRGLLVFSAISDGTQS